MSLLNSNAVLSGIKTDLVSETCSTRNTLKGVCSPLVTASAEILIPCLFPRGTSIFPLFTVTILFISLQIRLSITSLACSLAAIEMGSTMLSLFVFSNKFIVLHGPLELNNASNDLDLEKDDV